jgi:hypothetical protein
MIKCHNTAPRWAVPTALWWTKAKALGPFMGSRETRSWAAVGSLEASRGPCADLVAQHN